MKSSSLCLAVWFFEELRCSLHTWLMAHQEFRKLVKEASYHTEAIVVWARPGFVPCSVSEMRVLLGAFCVSSNKSQWLIWLCFRSVFDALPFLAASNLRGQKDMESLRWERLLLDDKVGCWGSAICTCGAPTSAVPLGDTALHFVTFPGLNAQTHVKVWQTCLARTILCEHTSEFCLVC